ncbi:MAG: mammalian cell entry protein [Rhodocyclaceae bacterium]|nr:mammalian cell entry protein [Rhodocyclaceae bacterium]
MAAPEHDPVTTPFAHATAKAYLLLALFVAMLLGFVLYVMQARGVFEEKRHFVLLAENAEGVAVGMEMSFAGFAIGRVAKIELGEDGKAHLHVEVPVKDAHWLRTSSVFTLERGLVGGAKLRAYTGILDDPPLPEGARRELLIGDATAGIPQLVATMRELVENLKRITGEEAPLSASLANVERLTKAMTGRQGALPGLLGEAGARQVQAALERANQLLESANRRLFAAGGLADDAHAAMRELGALLSDARASLTKASATLDEAHRIAVNARVATEDLDALRAEVEATLRRVAGLVEEIDRKWPFARERELKLP